MGGILIIERLNVMKNKPKREFTDNVFRTLIVKGPVTNDEMLVYIGRYQKLYCEYPEKIIIARDGKHPVTRLAISYLLNSIDGE